MKITTATALLAGAVALTHTPLGRAQTPSAASGAKAGASAPAVPPASAAKKELVKKLMTIQRPGIEGLARNLVEQPAAAMMQAAGRALQQMPADKRDAAGKAIEADIKKYVDDATPIVRDHAVRLAPSTFGSAMEERFTEDELKQLIAWLESPVSKKYAQLVPELQGSFTQKLVAEVRPSVEPKLQALEAKVRTSLGVPPPGAASAPPASKPASR